LISVVPAPNRDLQGNNIHPQKSGKSSSTVSSTMALARGQWKHLLDHRQHRLWLSRRRVTDNDPWGWSLQNETKNKKPCTGRTHVREVENRHESRHVTPSSKIEERLSSAPDVGGRSPLSPTATESVPSGPFRAMCGGDSCWPYAVTTELKLSW